MTQQTIIDPNDGLPNQPIEELTVNTVRTLSMDAVQELKIQTSAYAPEFGRTPGA